MKKRPASDISLETIRQAGIRHLERFPTTRAHLRRKLGERLKRAAWRGEDIPAAAPEWIETVLQELEAAGLLDDRLWARLRAQDLRRRGCSAKQVRMKLRERGLEEDQIREALATEESGEPGIAEERAALVYARRRRLGPFAPHGSGEDRRALQSFARSGFPYELAARVLAMDPELAHERLQTLDDRKGWR